MLQRIHQTHILLGEDGGRGEPIEPRPSPTSLCLLCTGLTSMVAHCGLVLVGPAWHSLAHHDRALGHYQGAPQLPRGDPVWEQTAGESGQAYTFTPDALHAFNTIHHLSLLDSDLKGHLPAPGPEGRYLVEQALFSQHLPIASLELGSSWLLCGSNSKQANP